MLFGNLSKKIIIITLIFFAMVLCACSSDADETEGSIEVNYNLKLNVDGTQIIAKWEPLYGYHDYSIAVSGDGEDKSFWVTGSECVYEVQDDECEQVTLKVAAPGHNYSNEVTAIVRYNASAYVLSPIGKTSNPEVYFCWNDYRGSVNYNLEIQTVEGKDIDQIEVGFGEQYKHSFADGEYRWRVTPFNESHMAGKTSEWAYFSVNNDYKGVENIAGVEVNLKRDALSTSLNYPQCCVKGPDGALYVSDTQTNVIRRIDEFCEIFAGNMIRGEGEGYRTDISLNMPGEIVFDADGNMLFSDIGNYRICKVDSNTGMVSTLCKTKDWGWRFRLEDDGSILSVQSKGVVRISRDGKEDTIILKTGTLEPGDAVKVDGSWYVLDGGKGILAKFTDDKQVSSIDVPIYSSALEYKDGELLLAGHTAIYKVAPDLSSLTAISEGYANVTYMSFCRDQDKEIVYITDSDAGKVFETENLNTTCGVVVVGGVQGIGSISHITGHGHYLYLLDNQNGIVWKYDRETQAIERYVGNGKTELAVIGNNRLETPLFYPAGISVDDVGALYVGEQHHVLKVDPITGRVELYFGGEGRGKFGFNGDTVKVEDALFMSIRGLHYDGNSSSVFVADTYNNAIKMVHNGKVYLVAGNGSEGPSCTVSEAIQSRLSHPHDMIPVDDGIFISDSWNNTVLFVDGDGNINPFAGKVSYKTYQGEGKYSGDGGEAIKADFNTPTGLFYENGILYIADCFNDRIRVVIDGKVYTLIGNEDHGYSDDGMTLNWPNAIYADESYVYVADCGNFLLRRYRKDQLTVDGMTFSEILTKR